MTNVLPLTREWIEMMIICDSREQKNVLPLTREWIEIKRTRQSQKNIKVLPLTREWIEIANVPIEQRYPAGSPSYEGVD